MAKDKFGREIEKKKLLKVLNQMVLLSLNKGFMDYEDNNPDKELIFFETDPNYNGISSPTITKDELIEWIID